MRCGSFPNFSHYLAPLWQLREESARWNENFRCCAQIAKVHNRPPRPQLTGATNMYVHIATAVPTSNFCQFLSLSRNILFRALAIWTLKYNTWLYFSLGYIQPKRKREDKSLPAWPCTKCNSSHHCNSFHSLCQYRPRPFLSQWMLAYCAPARLQKASDTKLPISIWKEPGYRQWARAWRMHMFTRHLLQGYHFAILLFRPCKQPLINYERCYTACTLWASPNSDQKINMAPHVDCLRV